MNDTRAISIDGRALDAQGLSALVRPRILVLVVVQTIAGYFLVRPTSLAPIPWLALGTAFVSAAGCALNHYLERDADARMARTQARPLVTGALTARQVVTAGVASLLVGLAVLTAGCGVETAGIQLGAAIVYLGIYTPLKSRTSTNTWVGAVPGALPLLAGAAAGGGITPLAWIAFALVFLWQLPHFFAIASMYRDDYRSGGMRMLSGDDPDDALLRWQMPMQVMSVVLVSILPVTMAGARWPYALVAVALGLVFLMSAFRFRARPDRQEARGVVRASVLYLPFVLMALVLDTSCSERDPMGDDATAAVAADEPELEISDDPDGLDGISVVSLEDDSTDELPPGIWPVDEATAEEIDDGTGLPSYGRVPTFELYDQDFEAFTNADLAGDVWVVDFMFTRCAGICIPMAQELVALQEDEVAARCLSITVDPSNDAPDVLRDYRAKYDGTDRWTLLTGSEEIIHGLSTEGFHLPVQLRREEPMEGMPSIFHSGRFALVDRGGHVRGFYSHDDRLEMDRLRRDIETLANLP